MPLESREQNPTPLGRGRVEPLTLARFLPLPENRSALAAVHGVLACVCSRRPRRLHSPLFLHGPPGSGKTHLVSALAQEVVRQAPNRVVSLFAAAEFDPPGETDLLVVEDLQHLPAARDAALVELFDGLLAHERQMVFTATTGPQALAHLSRRLTSRLASGLLVGLEPLQAASRRALLRDRVQRRQLAVGEDVLAWLAEQLPGGRQLEGAVSQLEMLARLHPRLDLDIVQAQFHEQVEAGRPTVERIAERVGGYFQVDPRQMRSRRRSRQVLLPRQVGMYLARRLTGLSLDEIGAYFGGRDHSTVLHACRKVEEGLDHDAALGGTVRQLHAELACGNAGG
jgi:chromosomal replication initiator protein